MTKGDFRMGQKQFVARARNNLGANWSINSARSLKFRFGLGPVLVRFCASDCGSHNIRANYEKSRHEKEVT